MSKHKHHNDRSHDRSQENNMNYNNFTPNSNNNQSNNNQNGGNQQFDMNNLMQMLNNVDMNQLAGMMSSLGMNTGNQENAGNSSGGNAQGNASPDATMQVFQTLRNWVNPNGAVLLDRLIQLYTIGSILNGNNPGNITPNNTSNGASNINGNDEDE